MFMAMTAMLIASCSSDDVVSTNTGRAIDFRTSVGTRGTETTTDNITKFWVTAIDGSWCQLLLKAGVHKRWWVFHIFTSLLLASRYFELLRLLSI